MKTDTALHEKKALAHLMRFLNIEGLSGKEGKVREAVSQALLKAGCAPRWMSTDRAHTRIGHGFETGNLVVKVPGTRKAPRRLFMAHMDTVPLCRGAVPRIKGNRIVSTTRTALGADNRTAVACLVTVLEHLLENALPRPPLTFLFTVGEEVGLLGARHVRVGDLGHPSIGINVDSGKPARFVTGAIGAARWTAEVHGCSAHAGLHPEDGISATLIAARAIRDVSAKGYFGRVSKRAGTGTSNIGRIEGGEATNQVTDFVKVTGEARSHDPAFLDRITEAYARAFTDAARTVTNRKGRSGRVKFSSSPAYPAFRMPPDSKAVRFVFDVARKTGFKPEQIISDGGLDANFLNHKGVPTITMGAGQHGAHTVGEYADIREYLSGCRLAVALAVAPWS
jgi:tripeptide aminopeptidase